ncbi:hypothetical protein HYT33_04490 [Candidatus Roizmanbacteria bacterium]|nr:hypothetical protein [Candidatus Roizmanbacteria bacterium]
MVESAPENPKYRERLKKFIKSTLHRPDDFPYANPLLKAAGLMLIYGGTHLAMLDEQTPNTPDPTPVGLLFSATGIFVFGAATVHSIYDYNKQLRNERVVREKATKEAMRPDMIPPQENTIASFIGTVNKLAKKRALHRYFLDSDNVIVQVYKSRRSIRRLYKEFYSVKVIDNVPAFNRDSLYYYPVHTVSVRKSDFKTDVQSERSFEAKIQDSNEMVTGWEVFRLGDKSYVRNVDAQALEYESNKATEQELQEALAIIQKVNPNNRLNIYDLTKEEKRRQRESLHTVWEKIDELFELAKENEKYYEQAGLEGIVFADKHIIGRIMRLPYKTRGSKTYVEIHLSYRATRERFYDERDKYNLVKCFRIRKRSDRVPLVEYYEEERFWDDDVHRLFDRPRRTRTFNRAPFYRDSIKFLGMERSSLDELNALKDLLQAQNSATLQTTAEIEELKRRRREK